ncbi:unnamed protein product [Dicrocoelium dendriticum]|nr:unnamed protein product [Dicrocoelium dendriticum]
MALSCVHICLVLLLYTQESFVSGQITEEQKSYLLKLHNDLRGNLLLCKVPGQPPVKGEMPMLKWNDALAGTAKNWSTKCTFGHDQMADRLVPQFSSVGQNVAAGGSVPPAAQLWVDEYKGYNLVQNTCNISSCGHYTQMVWAKTTDIGCSVTNCQGKPNFGFTLFIVCNYGPSGNFVGARPYEPGTQADCRSTLPTESTESTTPTIPTGIAERKSVPWFLFMAHALCFFVISRHMYPF